MKFTVKSNQFLSMNLVFWLGLLAFSAPPPAKALDNGFMRFNCPVGQALVGFTGMTGEMYFTLVIDELQPVCVALNADLSWNGNPSPAPGPIASPGGVNPINGAECPRDHVIASIAGRTGWVLDSFSFRCNGLGPDVFGESVVEGPFGGPGGTDNIDNHNICDGENEVASGFSAIVGAVVDRLALDNETVLDPGRDCRGLSDLAGTPARPALLAPADGANAENSRPTFAWAYADNVSSIPPYHSICISTEDGFPECAQEFTVGAITAHEVQENLNFSSGALLWHVRACNAFAENCIPSSDTFRLYPPAIDEGIGPQTTFSDSLWPVYSNPRCTNCHSGYGVFEYTGADHPNQAIGNRGNPGQCVNCHNLATGEWRNWKGAGSQANPLPIPEFAHLGPPGTGGFAHIPAQICHTVKEEVLDMGSNNTVRRAAFLEHVEHDPLIGWAFAPAGNMDDATAGQSATDVMSRDIWIDISMDWFDAGMPCNGDEQSTFSSEAAQLAGLSIDPISIVSPSMLLLLNNLVIDKRIGLKSVVPTQGAKLDLNIDPPRFKVEPIKESPKSPEQNALPINLSPKHGEVLMRARLSPRHASIEEIMKVLEENGLAK